MEEKETMKNSKTSKANKEKVINKNVNKEKEIKQKKKINENHPLFNEYKAKCDTLFHECWAKVDEERAKYPDWKGRDHPSDLAVYALEKECNSKLRDLQREYDFLFSDVTDDER